MKRIWIAVLFLLSVAAPARAALLQGPYEYPSPVSFDAQIGPQIGLGGLTPGGFKLQLGYNHRFATTRSGGMGVWFFANLGLEFGPGGVHYLNPGQLDAIGCGGFACGHSVDLVGGVQLTFRTSIPLQPFAKLGIGLAGAYGRAGCGDGGVAAPLANASGGARYFLTRHLAVGAEVALGLGPAFFISDAAGCGGAFSFWSTLSLLGGVQYAL